MIVINSSLWLPLVWRTQNESYALVALCFATIYDYLLRFDSEMQYVWTWSSDSKIPQPDRSRSRFSLINMLYILLRHLGILYSLLELSFFVFGTRMSDKVRYVLFLVSMSFQVVVIGALQAMMILRLHALYSGSTKMLYFLLSSYILQSIVSVAASIVLYGPHGQTIMSDLMQNSAWICGNLLSSSAFWAGTLSQLTTLAYEAVILALTLYCYVRNWATACRLRGLAFVLVRDNVLYFLLLLTALSLEITSFESWAGAQRTSENGLVYLCVSDVIVITATCIFGPRMVINIRMQERGRGADASVESWESCLEHLRSVRFATAVVAEGEVDMV
ncbi:hypothetical protein CONPUDRAFT_146358 [Coniophora puteana RWD-64-598 SS2]|uniref:DUF6533 domain-containing protein n=1 Tax=Coniophora puteana (strain RWD-64-598) TaxID=741705 RepID=A0A5M3MDU6_CONPW|nr:uncharacterized protein CONPUDRAFT_146358 [Coniophora puteana RWD-64-598 SS2]EIW77398.1 hypothetical protein CONPUDRAFT_146358 [Coniophora puteana RWD-64-598 SS2]